MLRGAIPLGALAFDPAFVLAQIAAVQAAWYLLLGVALAVGDAYLGLPPPDLPQLLAAEICESPRHSHAATVAAHLAACAGASGAVCALVERSKRCLDHAATVSVLHLATCWALLGLPKCIAWYGLAAGCCGVTWLGARQLCRWREAREVPLREGADAAHPQGSARQRSGSAERRASSGLARE
eukprot:TRINITY_DN35477_c0_g1_i2.p2 TRINITY_DN35477_c0_g1~~TRINITY_DN35477_c0_g1_i2.p2  ORF type:complete len:205 (+),score=54.66 TRINITY_DN35477_c0_g1_i2:68-616(+)